MVIAGTALRELVERQITHATMTKVESIAGVSIPSYGLDHAGYTFRLAPNLKTLATPPVPVAIENQNIFLSNAPSLLEADMEFAPETVGILSNLFGQRARWGSGVQRAAYLDMEGYNTGIDPLMFLYVILPHQCILAETFEYISVPKNMIGRLVPKSTYQRLFFDSPTMTLEPGWEGTITLELFNASSIPLLLLTGTGIAQVHFELLSEEVAGYNGRYQEQRGPTLAKI